MDFKDKTTEKLEAELKSLQKGTSVLLGLFLVLFVACSYAMFTKGDNSSNVALIVVPIALSSILPVNFGKIKKIKRELEARK